MVEPGTSQDIHQKYSEMRDEGGINPLSWHDIGSYIHQAESTWLHGYP